MPATPTKPTKYILRLCNVPKICLNLPCGNVSHSRSTHACTEPQKLFFVDLDTGTGLFFHAHAKSVDPDRAVGLNSLQIEAIRAARSGPWKPSSLESREEEVTKYTAAKGIDFKKVRSMLIRANENRQKMVELVEASSTMGTSKPQTGAVLPEQNSHIQEPNNPVCSTHTVNPKVPQLTEIIPMTKRGSKWLAVPAIEKFGDGVPVEGVEDDYWEAVDAEEAVESEYVLV